MPTEYQAHILKLDLPAQESLKNDAERCSADPVQLQSIGRAVGQQVRIVRADLPGYFAAYTVAQRSSVMALDRSVSPGYFAQHGIGLRRRRWFDRRDTASSATAAIVSDTLARRTWPDLDPIGRQLWIFDDVSVPVTATVVGVVSDIRSGPRREPMPIVYRPYAQHPPPWLYLSVEGGGRADLLLDAVRDAVSGVDARQPVDGPWTLAEWMRDQTNQTRLMSRLGFAVFATVLAGFGINGVVAHMVTPASRSSGYGWPSGQHRQGSSGLRRGKLYTLRPSGALWASLAQLPR